MTDESRAMLTTADAELLNRVCAGDTAAYQILYQRHEQAARRLARDLVVTAGEVDDVVAETFDQVLEVTRRGSGPADAFRPYLLTALRRICDRRHELTDPAEPYIDLAVAGLDDPLIVRAFLSLPERWMAVLWHTEIEGEGPAEVGPLLGLSRGGVAALRRRAKDGLTQAYLQMYTAAVAARECTAVSLRLGPFIRDAVAGPDSATVTEHLSECDSCRAVFAELSDISLPLRAMVAPVFLGGSAAYYLSATAHGAKARTRPGPLVGTAAAGTTAVGTAAVATTAARTIAAERAAGAAAAAAWWLRPAGLIRATARPMRWMLAGGAAVIAVAAIAFAVSFGGHGAPLKPADSDQAQSPTSLKATATVSQPSATPTRSSRAPVVVPVSANSKNSGPAAPPVSPSGSRSPAKPPVSHSPSPSSSVQLAATVDVYGGHHHSSGAVVVFQVSDSGPAGTGALVVSVALPAGSSLIAGDDHGDGGGGGGDGANDGHPGHDGWTCTATSSGASCSHGPITAGGHAAGVIFIAINDSSACGQTVSITAASGSASASAQSPEEIQC